MSGKEEKHARPGEPSSQPLARTSAVRWEEADPATYERMVSVLLSRLHPGARRIDGAGGDDGRDVYFPTSTGLEIFELKSFTGRLTAGRRRQVERSLSRAAQHSPIKWHLVVPIDPSPAEDAWFASLGERYQFPLEWLGLTWLDGQMASQRDIPRYFLSGGAEEVLRALQDLREEQAALARGVPDALDRLHALAARINELDPYYSFALSTKDGDVSVSVAPRYVGAELDNPITISGTFKFPDTPEGRDTAARVREAFEFGAPVEIPGDYVSSLTINAPAGLGGEFEGGTLLLGASEQQTDVDVPVQLAVLDNNGSILGEVPLRFTKRVVGTKGADLTGTDPSGTMHANIRLDVERQWMNMNFSFSEPKECLPATLLPTLQVVAKLVPPNRAAFRVPGGALLGPREK